MEFFDRMRRFTGMFYGILVLHKTWSPYRIANTSLSEISEIIENITCVPI
jgi:hypothetical protein